MKTDEKRSLRDKCWITFGYTARFDEKKKVDTEKITWLPQQSGLLIASANQNCCDVTTLAVVVVVTIHPP